MTEETNALLEEILLQLRQANSQNNDLWTVDNIAAYIQLSKNTVQSRIICKPDFPKAIKIPTGETSTNRRWKSSEVKAYVNKFRVRN